MNTPHVVADIMTREVAVLHEEDNLEHVLQRMDGLHVKHVPVVDGARLVGLITHQDMMRLTVSELLLDIPVPSTREQYLEELEENTFVARVMTRDPITVTPQTSIAEAAAMLSQAKVGCLPVVENDALVGIVTETDLLGVLLQLLKAEREVDAARN